MSKAATFQGTAPGVQAKNLESADDWQEYTAAECAGGLDLVAISGGRMARMIVLKDYGNLLLVDRNGFLKSLTSMPAGYVHIGQTRAVEVGQASAIVVYW